MPKRILPLTDMQVSRVKPQDKNITLFDGGGLFLLVTPSGGKLWRFKYRFGEKEKLLSFGAYCYPRDKVNPFFIFEWTRRELPVWRYS